jgi:hypothetical protein
MRLKHSSHVRLDASFHMTMAELGKELEGELRKRFNEGSMPPGTSLPAELAEIRCSAVAQARLTGQQFQISAISTEEQLVLPHKTTWEWEVTPKAEGTYPIYLSIDAIVTYGDGQVGHSTKKATVKTFERSVLVRVPRLDRVKEFSAENWQWLWTAVAVPVAGWFWVRFRRRRANQPSRPRPARRDWSAGRR